MNALKTILNLIIAPGMLLAACSLGEPPRDPMVSAVICNGDPYWCVVARSEMDAHRPAFVFVDGEEKGLVLPGRTLQIPVKNGETRQVNFCVYADVAETKQWKCSKPTETKFEAGNTMLVVFPLE